MDDFILSNRLLAHTSSFSLIYLHILIALSNNFIYQTRRGYAYAA
jgi:hypothetical protein